MIRFMLLKIERGVYTQEVFTGQNQHADSPVFVFGHLSGEKWFTRWFASLLN